MIARTEAPTVMSTFSGCGGSCLGFKQSGWEHRLAVEFVPEACRTYRANFPTTTLYEGNIRALSADEALRLMGVRKGELWCLEGSPPCTSFSTAGKRNKN